LEGESRRAGKAGQGPRARVEMQQTARLAVDLDEKKGFAGSRAIRTARKDCSQPGPFPQLAEHARGDLLDASIEQDNIVRAILGRARGKGALDDRRILDGKLAQH